MFELAILFIVVGIVLVIAGALTPAPAVLGTVGWLLFILGLVLLLVVAVTGDGGIRIRGD